VASQLPPGLAGFVEAENQQRQQEGHDMQRAAAALSFADRLKAREDERNFRSEYAALGTNPSTEAVMKVAGKYSDPQKMLSLHMQAQQLREAREERANQFAQNLDFKNQQLELQRLTSGTSSNHSTSSARRTR
jgi:hypothetical protein